MWYIVITKVSFTLVRILTFMQDDVRYHWMKDALNDNLFEIEKIHTDHNGSDMLMKSLPREKLGVCCSITGMMSPSTKSERGRIVGLFLMWKA